jgi:outer membrane protein W
MKKNNLPVLILILILVAILISMASSAFAHEEPEPAADAAVEQPKVRDWILRFGIVVADTNGSTSIETDPGSVDIRLAGGGGGFANIEYAVVPFLGLEFGSTTIGSDMNISTGSGLKHWGTDVDVLGMSALTLGANFRIVSNHAVNFYAGPMVAFNRYSKWSVYAGSDNGCWPGKHDCDGWVRVDSRNDSEVTWGAKVGVDIVLTKRGNWALSGSLSYIDANYNFDYEGGENRGSIDYNPVMFSFGGGFRW